MASPIFSLDVAGLPRKENNFKAILHTIRHENPWGNSISVETWAVLLHESYFFSSQTMCQSQYFFVVFGLHRSLMNNEDTVVPASCQKSADQLSSISSVPFMGLNFVWANSTFVHRLFSCFEKRLGCLCTESRTSSPNRKIPLVTFCLAGLSSILWGTFYWPVCWTWFVGKPSSDVVKHSQLCHPMQSYECVPENTFQNDSDAHITSYHHKDCLGRRIPQMFCFPNFQDWLHDLFLGYGDPGAAQYWKLPTTLTEIDFRASDFADFYGNLWNQLDYWSFPKGNATGFYCEGCSVLEQHFFYLVEILRRHLSWWWPHSGVSAAIFITFTDDVGSAYTEPTGCIFSVGHWDVRELDIQNHPMRVEIWWCRANINKSNCEPNCSR